jgi:hypothetical protein
VLESTPHGVSHALSHGTTSLVNGISEEVLAAMSRDDDHRDALLSMDICCFLSVPMTSGGTTFGRRCSSGS